ncbi:MAG: methyltransferase domain-containing protein [Magnetococcales bacterium]|nr:methyltransferase domain-containing protein [Magnetococcales bacterium]
MEPLVPLEPLPFARLDPHRVRRALYRSAPVTSDDLLAAINALLLERLDDLLLTPMRVLELSRRPGLCTTRLQRRLPKASIVSMGLVPPHAPLAPRLRMPWQRYPAALAGDCNRLPFPNDHFDLILSDMMLHWTSTPVTALQEMRRVIKPGGPLLLCTLGENTLDELKQCLTKMDQACFGRTWVRIPEFPTLHRLGDLLAGAGFSRPVADRDLIRPLFADTATLLAEMRRMGASNAHRQRPPGLMGKGYPEALATLYQQQFGGADGSIPVTVEILFGHAWKATPGRVTPPHTSSCEK